MTVPRMYEGIEANVLSKTILESSVDILVYSHASFLASMFDSTGANVLTKTFLESVVYILVIGLQVSCQECLTVLRQSF